MLQPRNSPAEAPAGPAADLEGLPPAAGAGMADMPLKPAAEAKRIMILGTPLVLEECLCYGSSLIAIGAVGRLGAMPLGVFSLARSVTDMTGIDLLNGITGAVDTFSSQAHGSRNFPAVGIVLQRALLLSTLAFLPLLLLYCDMHPVLLLLGQDAQLAAAAARYILLYSPVVVLHAVYLCLYRTLITQGASKYVMVAAAFYFAVTAPLNWLFIFWLGWDLDGSAAAAVAAEAAHVAFLSALCALHNWQQLPDERWWHGWSHQALQDWGPFLKLSFSSLAMIVLDWWAYDINTLLAGLLPNPDIALGATGIIYNLSTIIYMLPFGLAYAVCTRVGHNLGAASPQAAKLSAVVGTALGMLAVGGVTLLLLLSETRTVSLFTTDADIIQQCSALMLPLATLLITNGATALLSGILRGSGRQKLGAIVNGATNYLVGLPLQLLFAFKLQAGVDGLWWGLAAAACLQSVVLAAVVGRLNWHKEAARAARLVNHLSKASSTAPDGSSLEQPAGMPVF